jgi:hypothetical protein
MTIVKNPRSGIEAVAYGENLSIAGTGGFNDLCDHFVGLCYGWSHTGQNTAWNHYLAIPASLRITAAIPPLGALGFFKGGQGHVCIADGNGQWISTDQPWPKNRGKVGTNITTHQIEASGWGVKYVGATAPYFPHGVGPIHVADQVWTGVTPIVHVSYVQPGMHNLEVALVQEALRDIGLYYRAISGVFDSATRSAYSAWQHRCGYTGSDADGIPGIKSLTTLGNTTHLFHAS